MYQNFLSSPTNPANRIIPASPFTRSLFLSPLSDPIYFILEEPTMSPLALEGHDDYAKIAQLVQPPQILPHRSHDPANNLKRSDPFQFGSRYLEQGDDIFEFNAWDH